MNCSTRKSNLVPFKPQRRGHPAYNSNRKGYTLAHENGTACAVPLSMVFYVSAFAVSLAKYDYTMSNYFCTV